MEELFNDALEATLDAGIGAREFWEMTWGEIVATVQSRARVMEIERKERASMDYVAATLTGRAIAVACFGGEFPALREAYPGLFPELEQPHKQDWRIAKERLLKFAAGRNGRRRENDS